MGSGLRHRFGYPGNKQVGFGSRSHLHQSEDHRLHDRRKRNHRWRGQGRDSSQGTGRVTVRSNLDRYVGSSGGNRHCPRRRKHRFHHWLLGELQGGVGKPQFHNRESLGPRIGSRYGLRNTLHRHWDVDLGENRGAALRSSQAAADKEVAQAQAEIRRAAAVALEQENKAKVEEMQAKLVEAEAQVPMAMAEAFRNGNLGIMDYYKIASVEADTEMRSSISKDKD